MKVIDKRSLKFIFYTSLFLLIIRLWLLFFFTFFKDTGLAKETLADSFHHYYIGILLVIVAFGLKEWLKKYYFFVLAFGLALIIDEYTLIVGALHIKLPYIYLSQIDNVITLVLAAGSLVASWVALKQLSSSKGSPVKMSSD